MADTFYNVPADKQARLVAVHHRDADGTIVKDAAQPAPTINPIIGGGGPVLDRRRLHPLRADDPQRRRSSTASASSRPTPSRR